MKKIIACCIVISVLSAILAVSLSEDVYFIICNPKSYVNVRRSPKKGAEDVGRLECGDWFETDGKKKNGFIRIYGIGEYGEGWVYAGYVVEDQPIIEDCMATVAATGRVMSWRYAGKKQNGWVKLNTDVEVYAMSDEWAVTSRGYIKTKYLEVWR